MRADMIRKARASQQGLEASLRKVYNKQYLILTDYYSDYWEIDALPSTDSAAIIKVMKVQFARNRIPTLITDNAACTTSAKFQALDFIPLSPTGKWESRSICENNKEQHEEMPANRVRPVASITGMVQHPHVKFEDKNPKAFINWASKTYNTGASTQTIKGKETKIQESL
ncbi:hypothetical protein PR048_013939 [Dryococelus australis]|uniref:Integrase catalytic domain-containing protein n=1 Tax=Dryococelus australis TaxID=614101 RepID=A0ABQ9HUH8_9NEOP|nr:hypothetical protein PR048_013939 [Dryococelus australis]